MLCKNTVQFDQLTQLELKLDFSFVPSLLSSYYHYSAVGSREYSDSVRVECVPIVDGEQFTVKTRHLTNQKINSLFLNIPWNSRGNFGGRRFPEIHGNSSTKIPGSLGWRNVPLHAIFRGLHSTSMDQM